MNERSTSAPPIGHLAWREFFVGLRGVRGFAVSAFGASRVSAFVFLVFGRLVIYRTVAKSRSESGSSTYSQMAWSALSRANSDKRCPIKLHRASQTGAAALSNNSLRRSVSDCKASAPGVPVRTIEFLQERRTGAVEVWAFPWRYVACVVCAP